MLQKQTITIPLGLGVNTKTDEKLVEQGQFNLVCENAVFEKVGAVKKRQALKSLATTYFNPESSSGSGSGDYTGLSSPPTMAAALGDTVLLRNKVGEYLYSHGDSFEYKNSYPVPEVKVTSKIVYPGTSTVDHTDCMYDADEDLIIAVARDGSKVGALNSTGVEKSTLVIYSRKTDSTIVTTPLPNGGFSNTYGYVRCGISRVSGESYYYNVAVDTSGTMNIYIFNKYGQKHSTSYSIANMVPAGTVTYGPIGTCRSSDGETSYFICATTTSNQARFIAMRGTVKTYDVTFTHSSGDGMSSASAKFHNGLIYFAYSGSRQIVFNPDGTINVADSSLSGLSVSQGIAFDQDSVSKILGYGSAGSTFLWNSGSQTTENTNSLLISDKVTLGGLEIYLLSAHDTYYLTGLANGSGRSGHKTFAMISKDQAIPSFQWNLFQKLPSRIAKINDTLCVAALPKALDKEGPSSSSNGMQLVFFEVDQNYQSNSRGLIGKNLHFAGGFLTEFDGQNLIENGFLFPAPTPLVDLTTSGSLTGTYSYRTVLRYIDSSGQVTRSAPSAEITTTSFSAKDPKLTISVAPFGVKPKNCIVDIYRTTTGPGGSYYYIGSVPLDLYSAGTFTAFFTDSLADGSITSNELLYSSGDVLENDPAPSSKSVIPGGNRLFLIGLEDENEAAYSKEKLFGESVNFSDFFRIRVDTAQFSNAGGLIAGGYMDDKFIMFKRNSIFFVAGRGPNESGQGEFTEPELITAEAGCTDVRSVVLTPVGLMFKGDKGIYLLDRSLGTRYIGSGIESYNSYQVLSAVHFDKKNLVVFTMKDPSSGGGVLSVYDYFTGQWSIVPGVMALDSDVISGNLLLLDGQTNAPVVQDGTDFLDDSNPYSMRVKTPWIKVSGIQDFARIWSCTILGKYKSSHTLSVKVRYDYSDQVVQTFTITPDVADAQYQYRCHLRKQTCQSIQFEIYDEDQNGESMELTALTLEVGLKKGSIKLPGSRRY